MANGFGYFLSRADLLPPLPGIVGAWPPRSLSLEGIARFPWAGGRHPCLDVLIDTRDTIVGIESKRFEPFRSKGAASLSDAYWRPVWGKRMQGCEGVRNGLRDGSRRFQHLDATQLVKHAFGLRTAAARAGKRAVLVYLHCEPLAWPDGRVLPDSGRERHRREIDEFAAAIAGDEVDYVVLTWRKILAAWSISDDAGVRRHADAMLGRFAV